MNKLNLIAGSALLALLAACQDKATSAPATPAAPGDNGALAQMVGSAMDKARAELEKGNIDISHVAGAGMDIGKQGVGIAGKAVNVAISGIFNGDTDQAERELGAESKRIEAAARNICDKLQPMLDTQQKLAAELPAFKPYANLTPADIDDCLVDTEVDAAASNR